MMQDYLHWKNWRKEDFGIFSTQSEKYFSWHIKRAIGQSKKNFRVLEIGFGNGSFLGYCRKHGMDVTGVEANQELIDRAIAAGFKAMNSLEEISSKESFDLVVAFDVLEHFELPALRSFMEQLSTLLSKDGAIIIRVPNGDSPFGGRHQHGDVTHVTCFGEFKFHQIAREYGLNVVATGESPWYADEFDAPGLKSLVSGFARSSISYLLSMIFYRKSVDLSPNLVVVLKIGHPLIAVE